MGGRAGGEPDPAAEAEDRIQHRADRVRERTPVDDRDRRADRPAPAEEAGAIRLVLDDPAGLLLDRRDVRGPDRLLVPGSRTAGRQQGADIGGELGLHEQVLEGRVSDVGRLRREHDLRVRRQLDLARCGAEIGQRHAADLRVVLRRHDDGQAGRDRAVATGELGVILRVGRPRSCRPPRRSAGDPPTTPRRCACRAGRDSCPTSRGSRPRASGSPRCRPSGCSRIPRPSP